MEQQNVPQSRKRNRDHQQTLALSSLDSKLLNFKKHKIETKVTTEPVKTEVATEPGFLHCVVSICSHCALVSVPLCHGSQHSAPKFLNTRQNDYWTCSGPDHIAMDRSKTKKRRASPLTVHTRSRVKQRELDTPLNQGADSLSVCPLGHDLVT